MEETHRLGKLVEGLLLYLVVILIFVLFRLFLFCGIVKIIRLPALIIVLLLCPETTGFQKFIGI